MRDSQAHSLHPPRFSKQSRDRPLCHRRASFRPPLRQAIEKLEQQSITKFYKLLIYIFTSNSQQALCSLQEMDNQHFV